MLGDASLTGKNVDLARGFSTPTGRGWVIPGDGFVCMAAPDPVDGFGETCAATSTVTASGMINMLVSPTTPGAAEVSVLVPDGATASVEHVDGSAESLAVADGVASENVTKGTSVTVTSSTGSKQVIEIPDATKVRQAYKTCHGRTVPVVPSRPLGHFDVSC
jgi:hypothetical protein